MPSTSAHYRLCIALIAMFFTAGCTFVGDPAASGRPGFIMGLWHGAVSIVAVVVGIFNYVVVFARNNMGLCFGFVFMIATLSMSWNFVGLLLGVISLVLYVI